MRPTDLASVVLGLGAITLGILVPATAPFALPTGSGMVMAGLPQMSQLLGAAIAKLNPPKEK